MWDTVKYCSVVALSGGGLGVEHPKMGAGEEVGVGVCLDTFRVHCHHFTILQVIGGHADV